MRGLFALFALAVPVSLGVMAWISFSHVQNALGPNPAGPVPIYGGASVPTFYPFATLDPCAFSPDLCATPTPQPGLATG